MGYELAAHAVMGGHMRKQVQDTIIHGEVEKQIDPPSFLFVSLPAFLPAILNLD
jgi:hypothetical protein